MVAACVAWGIDNNLTRKVSLSDPLQIVQLKGLVAGPIDLALGLLAGGVIPAPTIVVAGMLVGFLGYGVSLVCFVLALRHLGSARTGAYFSTAPFLGTIVATIGFHDQLTWQIAANCYIKVFLGTRAASAMVLMKPHVGRHDHADHPGVLRSSAF
ncbi:MAG: DMT family transporter [Hyphomicrobiaceae bacterium]